MAEEAAKEEEPTMEEILASIRRIISEDGDETSSTEPTENADAAEIQDAEEPEAVEPEPEAEPDGEDSEEDVLELTEEIQEEPADEAETDDSDEAGFEAEEAAEPELEMESDFGAEAVLEDSDEKLVSDDAEERARASFAELSALLVAGYEGSGNTLEGLVRELLKPMLRSWLDENLPRIVEDAVEREVSRISRRDR